MKLPNFNKPVESCLYGIMKSWLVDVSGIAVHPVADGKMLDVPASDQFQANLAVLLQGTESTPS
jgi:hypothetical protein